MTQSPVTDLWHRLKDEPAFRVGTIYAGASWFLIEAADTLGMQASAIRLSALVLAGGFLLVVPTVWMVARMPRDAAPTVASPRRRVWRRRWGAGVGALLLLAAVLWGFRTVSSRRAPVPAAAARLAVLPFHATGSSEVRELGVGMVDLLTAALSDVGGISTVPSRTVLAGVRDVGDDPDVLSLENELRIGRNVGAGSVLTGAVIAFGTGVRLTAEIRDVADGVILASARQEGAQDSVLTLADRLAVDLLRELWRARTPVPTVRIGALTTTSPTALRAYLQGEVHLRAMRGDSAAYYFRSALAADSTFALAWLRLADATGWDGSAAEGVEARREFAARALALADRLPAREQAYVRASNLSLHGDFAAFDSLDAYVRRYPDDPMGWYALGDTRFHSNYLGRFDDAEIIGPFLEATRLDPALAFGLHHVLDITLAAGARQTFDSVFVQYARMAPPERAEYFRQQARIRWAPPDSVIVAFMDVIRGRRPVEDFSLLGGAVGALGRKVRLDPGVDPLVYPVALDSLARTAGGDRYWQERTAWLRFLAWEAFGRPDSSDVMFDRWLAGEPRNVPPVSPVLHRALSRVWQATDRMRPAGDAVAAARMLEDSIEAAPFISSTLHLYYLTSGDTLAAARFSPAPNLPPDLPIDRDAAEQGWRGWLLLARGDTARGVAAMDSSIQRLGFANANRLGLPWGHYAMALADVPGRRTQAIRMLRRETTYNVTNLGDHYFALARALDAEGDRAGAREAYGHVLRVWAHAADFRQPALAEARRALERLAQEPR